MHRISDIKMVVTDLDGTLLRDDKTISTYTESILTGLREKGILFAVATARPIRAVKGFLPFLSYDAAAYHNGAVVYAGDSFLGGFGIKNPTAITASLLKAMPDITISVEANDIMYSNYNADKIWRGIVYTKTQDFHEIESLAADKIIVEADSLEAMHKFKAYIPEDLYLLLSENQLAMIMNKQATKANGVRLLADYYGIAMEQIIAFGDDYNDIDMLKSCGIGVAVADALEEVKAVSDYGCEDSNQDGVARWLAEYIL